MEYDFEINENNLRDSVLKIAFDLRPDWKKHSDKEIIIKDLNGGLTNRLVGCYLEKNGFDTSDTLLFRMYGKNTENFINRDNEITTMKLVKKINLGPEFYAKFKNGICYEYLPGIITDTKLVNDENIYPKIAQAIANIHLVEFRVFLRESDLESNQKPYIFVKIRELLGFVKEDYKLSMPNVSEDSLKTIPSLKELKEELHYLESYFKNYAEKNESLIVFSHNDLLLANIVYNQKNDSIKFIDYEYGGLNYQAYDIANHFNEFAGVDEPNYAYFPSKEFQLKWLRIYLDSFYSKVNKFFTKQTDEPVIIDDERLNQFYDEVNKFTLTSHFMWAIWSLMQAQNSHIGFDFVEYSKIRFDEYFKRKSLLLSS